MAAVRWMGRGDKQGADGAAVDAMRIVLSTVADGRGRRHRRGREGQRPDALQRRAHRRRHARPRPTSRSTPSTAPPSPPSAGAGPWRSSPCPSGAPCSTRGPCVYMEKLAVGPRARGPATSRKSLDGEPARRWPRPWADPVRDLTAVILDRPRHERADRRGARRPGPASGSSPTATWPAPSPPAGPTPAPTSSSGIGGTPEGVHRRRRAQVHGRRDPGPALRPATTSERAAALAAGYDLDAVLTTDDLVRGDNCFFAATGITDGELLHGVHYHEFGATTQSLVMRSKSGTAAQHRRQPPAGQAGGVQLHLIRLSQARSAAPGQR